MTTRSRAPDEHDDLNQMWEEMWPLSSEYHVQDPWEGPSILVNFGDVVRDGLRHTSFINMESKQMGLRNHMENYNGKQGKQHLG